MLAPLGIGPLIARALRLPAIVTLVLCAFAIATLLSPRSGWAEAPPATSLSFKGTAGTKLTWSQADLQGMPRQTVKILNEHTGKTETYSGVLLMELLRRGGVPQGKDLRGQALALALLVEATDGYRVVFGLGELDPGVGDAQVLVADRMNDAPLDAHSGPFKLIVPRDKRPARSVRNLMSLTVVPAGG